MKKVSVYRCPTCNMKYKSLDAWNSHTLEMHKDKIPEGFTPSRYFYLILTGKGLDGPYCPVCHKPNPWNENTLKYSKYCGDELCRKELARQAKQNMVKKYGKEHLMNDPEYQKNLLKHRRISGTYKFKDGHEFDYTGSYEKDFLKMLDTFMQWPSGDLISPSPNIYKYIYDGQEHFYIPDFFIPSLKLEIEIKDGGDNPNMHHKIQAVDKVKEKNKDEAVMNTSGVNYIKLVNKEYHDFFEYLLKIKEEGIVLEASLPTIDNSKPDYSQYDKTLQKIINFNIKLNNMEYIIPNDGNIITRIKANDFVNYYRMLTPKEFYKYNGGICWDYVAAQADWFNKNNIKYKTFYNICDDGNSCPTHTYSIINHNNSYYWFESSWKNMHGLYRFKSEIDAINYISNKLYITAKNSGSKIKAQYNISFNPLDTNLYGLSCVEYMNYMSKIISKNPSKYKISNKNKISEPIEIITEPLSYESVMTACAPIVPYQGVIVKPGMEPDHFAKDFRKKKKSKITDDFIKSYDSLINDIKDTIHDVLGTTPVNTIRLTSTNKDRYLSRERSLKDINISDEKENVYLIYDDKDNTLGYFSISNDENKYIKKLHITPETIGEKEDAFKDIIRIATNSYSAKGILVPAGNRTLISILKANGFKYVEETPDGVLMVK